MQDLPYDNKNLSSIFEYSKLLINKSLHDIFPEANEYNGKGGLGQLVEKLFFKYEINSRQVADFSEVNVDLKCTPLKHAANSGKFLIKERLVCSMINYISDWDKTFEESHFYKKCVIMLIMFYLHQPDVSKLNLKFIYSVLWKIPYKDLLIIKQDYNVIITKIRNGKAHTLSEGDTMYLGACRKGSKGDVEVPQHGSDILAPRRAWSLKPSYMRTLLEEVEQNNVQGSYCNFEIYPTKSNFVLSTEDLQRDSFDNELLNRFSPFIGKNYYEICQLLDINPISSKSKYFILANTIAGDGKVGNVNKSEEFVKSGLTMKTIRINKKGRIKESMSFENINYREVYECEEWTDSRLYELFTNRFLFVVFRETDDVILLPNMNAESCFKLDKVAFWTMPPEDIAIARQYWENIRANVVNDKIEPDFFWSIKDNRKFHVRPKARNAYDVADNPNGGKVRKYCYWFNSTYVKEIIDEEL